MESFTLLQNHLETSGICSQQSPQKNSFNTKNSSVLVVLSISAMLFASQLFSTNSFELNAFIVHETVSTCFCIGIFITIICETPKLFRLIENVDTIVKDSK